MEDSEVVEKKVEFMLFILPSYYYYYYYYVFCTVSLSLNPSPPPYRLTIERLFPDRAPLPRPPIKIQTTRATQDGRIRELSSVALTFYDALKVAQPTPRRGQGTLTRADALDCYCN
jgi:hypothetical protein